MRGMFYTYHTLVYLLKNVFLSLLLFLIRIYVFNYQDKINSLYDLRKTNKIFLNYLTFENI